MYKYFAVISDTTKYYQCKKAKINTMLISFFYLRKNYRLQELLQKDDEIKIIVDSGLYSFSNSVTIDEGMAKEYAEEYIKFVSKAKTYDCYIGFFELDYDLIGYDYYSFVKPYQQRLLNETEKIIPIMQKKRTIEELKEIVKYNVNCIAIPFASSIERNYFDWRLIIDIIHDSGKKVHMLGCSSIEYLVYADQSDSSSWFMTAAMGSEPRMINGRIQTFHYSESNLINNTYDERAVYCARFYKEEFEKKVNEMKKMTATQQQRLF